MSKQYNMRWSESDSEKLQRAIKNFNAKLYRVAKNNPEMIDYLPQKVTKAETIKTITTRADFNRTINSLQRFTKRGAEKPLTSSKGAKATEWEVKEYKLKERLENQRRAREKKRIEAQEVTTRGQGTGFTRAEMGSIRENAVKPIKRDFNTRSQKEWDLMVKNIDRALDSNARLEKKLLMRENYIKGMHTAGVYTKELEELVRAINIDKFVDTADTDEQAKISFYYTQLEAEVKREALFETWESVLQNQNKSGV